ncbi:unnamed protein product [Arabidopsis halleri]
MFMTSGSFIAYSFSLKKLIQQRQSETIGMEKQLLGELLYPLLEKLQPQLANKITGMLLEMDKSELLLLLKSPEELAVRVDEACSFGFNLFCCSCFENLK